MKDTAEVKILEGTRPLGNDWWLLHGQCLCGCGQGGWLLAQSVGDTFKNMQRLEPPSRINYTEWSFLQFHANGIAPSGTLIN